MKKTPFILAASIAAMLAFPTLAPRALAQQFWDGPHNDNTTIEGGNGVWNSVNINWANAAGVGGNVFNPAIQAVFQAAAGTVTLGENLSVTSLLFRTNGYVVANPIGFTLRALGASADISVDPGLTATINAPFANAGAVVKGLSKSGTGTLVLGGFSSYTGATNITAGTLRAGDFNVLDTGTAVTVAGGSTFDLNGNDQNIGSLAGAGNVTLGAALLGTGFDNTSTTFSGVISGPGAPVAGGNVALVKFGTGTQTLSGLNTYTGNTVITAGVLQAGAANTLSTATQVQVGAGSTFALNSFDQSVGSLSGTGGVTLGTATFTIGNDNRSTVPGGGALNFGGVISGAGGLTKVGIGTQILSGVNTYAGPTNITGGILRAGVANTLSNLTDVTVGGAGTFDLAGFNQSVGSLAGSGGVTLGAATLTTGGSNNTTSFSGIISGTGGLTKVGSGTQTLTGANTYSGITTLNAGVLAISADNNLGAVPGAPVANRLTFNGGTLRAIASFTLAPNRGITLLAGGGTIAVTGANVLTYAGVIAGSGGLTKSNGGTLILSGGNTFTGPTNIIGGILRAGVFNTLDLSTALTVGAGATFDLNNFDQNVGSIAGAGSITLGTALLGTGFNNTSTDFSGVISGTGAPIPGGNVALVKFGAGTQTLSGANTYTGNTVITAGTLQAGAANTLSTATQVQVGTGSTFSLNNFSQSIGSLSGAGNVTLGTAILTIGNDNLSTIPGGAALNFGGVISGTGGLTKVGTGTQILSGVNTYSGPTNINAGILLAGVANTLSATTAVTVAGGATFNLNNFSQSIGSLAGAGSVTLGTATLAAGSNNTSTTFSGVISGAGGFTKTGTGILTLSGANTYLGPTNINAGVLRAGTFNTFDLGTAVTVAAGATFDLNNNDQNIGSLAGAGNVTLGTALLGTGFNNTSTTFSGVISGTGTIGLVKFGTGVQTLSGSNTYSGNTVITAGTLRAGAANTLSTGTQVQVGTGSTFNLNNFAQSIGSLSGAGNVTLGTAILTIGNDNRSTIPGGGALNFGGVISGTGGLTKVGTGTQILSGGNTYTGPTNITGGILRAGAFNVFDLGTALTVGTGATFDLNNLDQNVGSLAGAGNITLGTALLGTGFNNTSTTFSGVISGTGTIGLVKFGTGTQTLSGQNTYTGNTVITAGTLRAGAVNTLSTATQVQVGFGSTFSLNNFAQSIGSLSGAGSVTLGTASLTIGNDNRSTIPGGGALNFGGVISGTGGLTKVGTGTQILSGVNTYTGPTNVTGGTLRAGVANAFSPATDVTVGTGGTFSLNNFDQSIGSLAGGGSVALGTANLITGNSNTDATFAGVISGTGGLTKVGAGTELLSGANTYSGNTTITGGILQVDGSIASPNTLIRSAGTLAGLGVIGGNVFNGGTVRPGSSAPGKLTVNGNYTQTPAGTLVIRVAGAKDTEHDLLAVQGNANLDGTLRLVQVAGPRLRVGDKVQIVTATGGVNGTFATVTNPFDTMLRTAVTYQPNSVTLEAMQGAFLGVPGLVPNARAVAGALDRAAGDPRVIRLFDFLNTVQTRNLNATLLRIAPEELASVYHIAVSLANIQTANIQRRTDDIRAGSVGFSAAGFALAGSGPSYSGALSGVSGPSGKSGKPIVAGEDNRWGVFITGVGEFTNVGDTDNARGYDLTTGGFNLGLDYRITSNFAFGFTAGYARTGADLADGGKIDVDGGKFGLYSTYFTGPFYVDASVHGGYNSYDSRRRALLGTARGDTEGGEFNALFATGYDWKRGGLTIGPVASFQYTYLGIDSFTERGGLAPLIIDAQEGESIRHALGARASYDWKVGGRLIRPELRVSWQHEYGDTTLDLTSGFANGAGGLFNVTGPQIGRDSLLIGAGASILWNERVATYLYYDGELGRTNYDSHNVSGGMRVAF